MDFPSKLVEKAVNEIASLPGIGKKTALRLALHILKEPEIRAEGLTSAILDLRKNIKYCKSCHSISDEETCGICNSTKRDESVVCIVEGTKDVMVVENTNQYFGKYHVLGGIISPIDGIGPSELNIQSLISRVKTGAIKEIILALSPTMEGDTTAFYLTKKLKEYNLKISSIARGIPIGGELEYADEVTLGRSILTRTDYNPVGQ